MGVRYSSDGGVVGGVKERDGCMGMGIGIGCLCGCLRIVVWQVYRYCTEW